MVKFHFPVFILTKMYFPLLVFFVVRVLFRTCLLIWIKSPRPIKCVHVGYSRTQKGYWCYSSSNKKYFVSTDVTFLGSVPYCSPKVQSLHRSISLFHHLSCRMHLPSVTSEHCRATCTTASKGFQIRLHSSTKKSCLWTSSGRFLLSNGRSTSSTIKHQHLPPILMFILPSAKINGLVLIIIFPILFSMIILIPPFASLPCPCLLCLLRSYKKAISVPAWKQVMDDEMNALVSQ